MLVKCSLVLPWQGTPILLVEDRHYTNSFWSPVKAAGNLANRTALAEVASKDINMTLCTHRVHMQCVNVHSHRLHGCKDARRPFATSTKPQRTLLLRTGSRGTCEGGRDRAALPGGREATG